MRFLSDVDPRRAPRRNDVAYDRRERDFVSYGRISRIEGDTAVIVNGRDGTLHVPIEHVGVDYEYKGIETWGPTYEVDGVAYRDRHFRYMPTLRAIKQLLARREGPEVWAKDRRRIDRRRRRALIEMARMDERAGLSRHDAGGPA